MCWSLRCSWNIACRRCSNYIFILYWTPGFNRLGKDKCKTRRESVKFWDSDRILLEILRYVHVKTISNVMRPTYDTLFKAIRYAIWTSINSSPPSAACIRRWTGSTLVQIMACRLVGAGPLSDAGMLFIESLGTNISEILIEIHPSYLRKWI